MKNEKVTKMSNKGMRKAAKAKNDEFYTDIRDIENELKHYKEHFEGKVVFCNCDDPKESMFWKYFCLNFNYLGLKKLIATHYSEEKSTYKLETLDGKTSTETPLRQNGDFRSPECIELLKEADIVVTNPPFSLFREYIAQLIEYDKKFIILGNFANVIYKDIFRLIKEDKIWAGVGFNKTMEFRIPTHYVKYSKTDETGQKYAKVPAIGWFTNLEHKKHHDDLPLYKIYNSEEYPKYDNYDAINVDKTKDIPMDYEGVMGVPVSFLDKYNPDQFEILGFTNTGEDNIGIRYENTPHGRAVINGVEVYTRLLIKNRKPQKDIN